MHIKSSTRTYSSSRYSSLRQDKKERDLLQRQLLNRLIAIFALGLTVVVGLTFFGPKIGYFFGFLSKYRNLPDTNSQIKPTPPILSKIPSSTKEDKIDVTGYAKPGTTVVLFVNGPEIQRTTAGSDGMFTFGEITLHSGQNSISAKSIGSANVESDLSSIYTVIVDKDKPVITINSPKDDQTVRNLDKRIKIEGFVNEKVSLTVNGRLAILRPDLTFEFLLGVSEGEIEIKIEATDLAGNVEIEKLKVKYVQSSN